MNNIFRLVANTLRLTFRKKSSAFILLGLPVVAVIASLAFQGGGSSEGLSLAVADSEHGAITRDLVDGLAQGSGMSVERVSADAVRPGLVDGRWTAALIIPPGFEASLSSEKPLHPEILGISGQDSTAWLKSQLDLRIADIGRMARASGGDAELFRKIYTAYKAQSFVVQSSDVRDLSRQHGAANTSLAFLIMFMMMFTGISTQFMLKEKQNRTYYRILSAPVDARQYVLANVIATMLLVAIQVIVVLVVMTITFGTDGNGNLAWLFVVLMCFGLASVGISLTITAFSESSYAANTIGGLIGPVLTMLGGCFWPLSVMPAFMQKLAYFTPQRWAMDGVLAVQSSSPPQNLAMPLLLLLAFALVFFLAASYRLRRGTPNAQFV